MTAVVEIRGLRVVFGAVVGVDQLDLTVCSGAAVALVGQNGAGKSTTLRAVAGVIPPTSGSIRVCGICSTTDPVAVRALVGYCPDTGGLIPRATPWEHLQLAAKLHNLPNGSWESRAEDLLQQFDLLSAADRVTAGFSHGMARRMSVVLAAFPEPEALLLDEPFDGVDPLGIEAAMAVITHARARGAAIVVSTHLLPLAVDSCDEVLVLRQGRIVGALRAEEMVGQAGAERYRTLLS